VRHGAIWNNIFAFSMANMPSLFMAFGHIVIVQLKKQKRKDA
jgi:hypothetical protein